MSTPRNSTVKIRSLFRFGQIKKVKVARLQSEFCTKVFFFEPRIFLRKMLRNFPRNFWAFVLWVRKNPWKIPSKFPTKFSCEKSKKIHRRASAGAQGDKKRPPSVDTQEPKEDLSRGNPNGGLANGGLARSQLGQQGPFGATSALLPWLWGAEELVPIGPEKAPIF